MIFAVHCSINKKKRARKQNSIQSAMSTISDDIQFDETYIWPIYCADFEDETIKKSGI